MWGFFLFFFAPRGGLCSQTFPSDIAGRNSSIDWLCPRWLIFYTSAALTPETLRQWSGLNRPANLYVTSSRGSEEWLCIDVLNRDKLCLVYNYFLILRLDFSFQNNPVPSSDGLFGNIFWLSMVCLSCVCVRTQSFVKGKRQIHKIWHYMIIVMTTILEVDFLIGKTNKQSRIRVMHLI